MRCECDPVDEVCDGLDNDCDGAIDDGLAGCDCATPEFTRCGTVCVDTMSDRANCGACGRACDASLICTDGACAEPRLDLLFVIDDSNSMRENQVHLLSQLGSMIDALVSPPCASATNPSPHACDRDNGVDRPLSAPVRDLHVGVVSTDLGTPGTPVPGCRYTDLGDDGLLDPIAFGQARIRVGPRGAAPPVYGYPLDCADPSLLPPFVSFVSGTTDVDAFTHDAQCNASLDVYGCGLESQLEAAYRALVIHDARERSGNTSPNAGFLRASALLAIVLFSDEEDGSVRDCRFANGTPCEGSGAIDVYDPASTAWASEDLNLRFYASAPCGPQDPTWTLDRYVDPSNPNAGFLSLKPGHPERVVFSAITGVPLELPTESSGGDTHVVWDRLLGTPGPRGHEDFCGRDSSGLAHLTSDEGPVSMAQANLDPNCPLRVVPACRREGSAPDPSACTADVQYFAWPARRIVEIARRFDESPLCHGAPCRNGSVASICRTDYTPAIAPIVARLR